MHSLTPLKDKSGKESNENEQMPLSLKKDMIDMILRNSKASNKFDPFNDKSIVKLKDLIVGCHSYEELSPRDTNHIDFQSFIEDLRYKYLTWNVTTLSKLCNLHSKDLKKNFDYHLFAEKMQQIREDEISREYKSGIMDPSRIAAVFERTKSLYRIMADSQLRQKLKLNFKKPQGKYKFTSELF